MSINRTSATLTNGTLVTATTWTNEVQNLWIGLQAAWDSYTPTLTSTGTNPTLGTGNSVTGTYYRVGKTVIGASEIVAGTAGYAAGTGAYRVLLPVALTAAAVSNGRVIGDGVFFDASTSNFYQLILVASTTTTCTMVLNGAALMSATAPVVPAINDQWRYQFTYEAT